MSSNFGTLESRHTSTWLAPKDRWFFLAMGISTCCFYGPLQKLAVLALKDDRYSPNLFIPVISFLLIWFDRARLLENRQYQPRTGVLLFLAGTAAAVFGYLSAAEEISLFLTILGIVLIWISVLVFSFGPSRIGLFPFLFLFLMVPLPSAILDQLVVFLQSTSAEMTARIFRITHVPVFRESFYQFSLPGFTIEIAKECSGIRSSMSLLISSLVVGHLTLQTGWAKASFTFLTLPVVILKNAIRIVLLSTLGLYVDQGFLTGNLHHRGGLLFSLIGIGILVPIFVVLRKMEGRRPLAPLNGSAQKAQ